MTSLIALRSSQSPMLVVMKGARMGPRGLYGIAASGTRKKAVHQARHSMMTSAKSLESVVTPCLGYLSQYYSDFSYVNMKPEKSLSCPSTDADEDHIPLLLACSSRVDTLMHDDNFVRRIAQRLKALAKTLWGALLATLRGTEVAVRLSPLLVLTPAAIASSAIFPSHEKEEHGIDYSNPVSNVAWWYTLRQLQALGPAFVKLAQWVATRRDTFPPNVCDRFAKLHDRGFTHSWSYTHRTLTQAFGDYEEKGLHIDPKDVIGCGSAAQVYKGVLTTKNENGEEVKRPVAVKVLHPRFESLVESDLSFMEAVADTLHAMPFLHNYVWILNLPRVADNFGVILRRQADLRVEGENLNQFRHNFHGENQTRTGAVSFPRPVDGWMDRTVLVQTLVQDSTPIGEYLKDETEEGWAVRRELADPLLRAFLKMVFLDNFVHCDLHPGNVLIQTVPVPPKSSMFGSNVTMAEQQQEPVKRNIVFLDAGIAASLSPKQQKNLRDLFRAVILNDGDRAGRLMVERAPYERCSEVEGGVDAFARGVEEIVTEFHGRRKQGLTLGAVRIGSLLSQVLDLCRVHGVEVDPAMASIVISTLVLEGLGRSLEPDLNLIDCAVPFILGRGKV